VRVRLVHYITRHGDRTPITSLKDSEFWAQQMPAAEEHPNQYKVVSDDSDAGFLHFMAGAAPFGQLTRRGIEQMRGRGVFLRKKFGPVHIATCRSTYFTRTIQSAQHLLLGLEADPDKIIVDTRNWRSMIPDGDTESFRELVKDYKPPLSEEDVKWRDDLTRKVFACGIFAFEHGPDPNEVHGIGIDRLTETLVCLQLYHRLPPSVSHSDTQRIYAQMALLHFSVVCQPAVLSQTMGPFVCELLEPIRKMVKADAPTSASSSTPLHIFSGHDSTLCGLIQAFNLRPVPSASDEEGPATTWYEKMFPNYADALRIELLELCDDAKESDPSDEVSISAGCLNSGERFFVRFVFDGHGTVGIEGHTPILPVSQVKPVWD